MMRRFLYSVLLGLVPVSRSFRAVAVLLVVAMSLAAGCPSAAQTKPASQVNSPAQALPVDLPALFHLPVKPISYDAPSFAAGPSVMVFLFLSPDCPLCRSYSVILNQLYSQFGTQATFYGIIAGRSDPDSAVLAFVHKYHILFPVYRDAGLSVAKRLHASVTPQAIVLDGKGRFIYSGLVDDRVAGLGAQRAFVNRHYLQEALNAEAAGQRPVTARTTPVGCLINAY